MAAEKKCEKIHINSDELIKQGLEQQHSKLNISLSYEIEGPDDVFASETPFENQSFFRVDVPSRYEYLNRNASIWGSYQSSFWKFIYYLWNNEKSHSISMYMC